MLVSNYMTESPVTIRNDADYSTAFDIMEAKDLHHLPVVDAGDAVVGILTRRDLQLAARHFHEAPVEVAEVMHSPVFTTTADASLESAARMMMENRIGGLPVMDGNSRVVGMLTETDLFRALIDALGSA
jgi:acetoin utilization protein AcuB